MRSKGSKVAAKPVTPSCKRRSVAVQRACNAASSRSRPPRTGGSGE